ncbi:hypothetical protein [Limosilactobacillus reuteri]|uniref:hypothetical protein n=1 Tax=Limosilactobacillus reuteri TaxID=1598 RepID=UPI00129BDCA7|nr:hypothetical protein [Limosilactobacillus reuteri]MRH30468.1 hypothetical protein [Limosilactobacillus reuteri]
MRVMNLMIVLAVIAIIILAAQYFSQLRKNRNGNNFVSGGRVFFNWTLVAVLVICVGGIVFGSIHSHRQEAKPAQTDNKTENVEYAASDSDNLGKVSVQFDRKVTLNDNGEAKVKFKVSPQTTLTIRGHKSKEIVKTFKASKGESLVNHTYTFDVAGTYDIIAERGDQKVTKQLKVKGNDNTQESSSSSSSVSSSSSSVASSASSSTVSSSSSSTASTAQSNSESSSSTTAASSNNGGSSRNYNTSRPRYSGNGGGNRTSGNSTPTAPAQESSTPAYSQENNGYVSDGPQY